MNQPSHFQSKTAATVLIVGGVLVTVFMLHHPTPGGHGPEAVAAIQTTANWVHGLLIACLIFIVAGLHAISHRMFKQSFAARLASTSFALGVGCYVLAATVNGFAVPAFAAHFAANPETSATSLNVISRFAWEFNQALSNIGAIATGMAIALWSLCLLRWNAGSRQPVITAPVWLIWLTGTIGIVAGIAPALALILSYMKLEVLGMTIVVAAHAVWFVLFGTTALLSRGDPTA